MFVNFGSGIIPIKILSTYRLLASPVGVVTRQSSRRCWGLVLKCGGKTYYDQQGKTILSDKNHVVLLPKGAEYAWTCTEPGECIVIDFEALGEEDTIRCAELKDNETFLTAFAKLERLEGMTDTVSTLESMHLLYGLLAYISKAEHKKYVPDHKRLLLAPAIAHMTEKYADPGIQNEDLAALCNMSTVYFRKTFEAIYGTPPIRYLHILRIQKAKAILSGDYDSIRQVAESTGYSSVYHFSKMFKLYTGQSPTSYAKSIRK